jgi:predicted SAM-dependent methyltransferase
MIVRWPRGKCPMEARSRLINLGCGAHFHPDWDNYDFEPVESGVRRINLSQPLPFHGDSYEVCYMSHVLEHLPRERVPRLLSEVLDTLKPGGVLRLVVPDLEMIVRLYLRELDAAASGDKEAALRHEWMTLELIDQMTRTFSGGFMGRTLRSRPLPHRKFIEDRIGWEAVEWLNEMERPLASKIPALSMEDVYNIESARPKEDADFRGCGEIHKWMYDRVSLKRLLHQAGFGIIKVCAADESAIPKFASYCLDTDHAGRVRKPDSLFVEAVAPPNRTTAPE